MHSIFINRFDDRYYCIPHFDTTVIDLALDSRSQDYEKASLDDLDLDSRPQQYEKANSLELQILTEDVFVVDVPIV